MAEGVDKKADVFGESYLARLKNKMFCSYINKSVI